MLGHKTCLNKTRKASLTNSMNVKEERIQITISSKNVEENHFLAHSMMPIWVSFIQIPKSDKDVISEETYRAISIMTTDVKFLTRY